MATKDLIPAVTAYIETADLYAAAEAGDREHLRLEMERARREVEGALRTCNEARARPGAIQSILVAVDDSEPAQWAFAESVRIAELLDARISLVHVVDTAPVLADGFVVESPNTRPMLIEQARGLLECFSKWIPRQIAGGQFLREGVAARQIIAAAKESDADLIVIGTHGRGALGRFLIGSVAEAVVRHSLCPVLTVSQAPPGVTIDACHVETTGERAGGQAAHFGA